MFELKPLSKDGVDAALQKAERYRLMNESWEAESICRDILAIEPDNQDATVTLILALADQLGVGLGADLEECHKLVKKLQTEYEQAYYTGIIYEHQAKDLLEHGTLGSGPAVYDWLEKAMRCYEKAEALSSPGNDDAVLRWNTCARLIMRNNLRPPPKPPGFAV